MAVQQILDANFKFINQEFIHGVKSGNSLALGGASSTANSQIILQSGGQHTIDAPQNSGFFVDPIRSTNSGDGLKNVIYDPPTSEFRLIDGNGGGGGSSSGHNNSTDASVALGKGSSVTADNQIIIQSGTNTIDAPQNSGFFVDPIRSTNNGDGLMNVLYDAPTSEFRIIDGGSGGGGSSSSYNHSTDKSVALGKGSSVTADNQIIIQSGTNTIDAPDHEGLYMNPLRDIHDSNDNGSNPQTVYYDPDSHEVYFNTSLKTNNSTGNSLALGADAESTADSQIILQSGGAHTIQPAENAGFFVDPVRDVSSGSGLMEVRYDHSNSEFRYISGSGTITNNSTDTSVAIGKDSAPATDSQIILQSGGDHTISAPNNAGFFVDPIRSTSDGDGLMNVIYDTSSSEFRLIDGAGGGGGSSSGYNHSTSTSVAIGKDSAPTHDGQIILQSGSHTIDAPNNEGFFVDPIRNSNSSSGFMDVRYHPSTSEFRVISGTENAFVHESGTVRLPNLPTSDPSSAGQVYNDGGFLKISSG